MTEILAKNKHLLYELSQASIGLKHTTGSKERQGLEDLVVYLSMELEKRARYNHYFDLEKTEHWWERAAAQFRIGEKVGKQMREGRKNPAWVKETVERWVDEALAYYAKGHVAIASE